MTVTGTGGVLGTLLLLSILCNLQPREVHKTKIRNIFNNSLHEEELNSMCKSMSLQKLFPTNLEKGSKSDRHCNTIVISGRKTQTFYLLLTLILSNDISLNPGPIKYPCGECQKPVRKNQHGILCDDCELWHHIKCINMPLNQYNELSNSTDSWFCKKCTLPNFTDSFFDFHHLTSNTDTDSDDDLTVSASDITVPTSDVNTEAHILDQDDASHDIFHELYTVRKKHPNKFISSYLNINSLRYKFCSIQELLCKNIVDLLIIAETKIDQSFPDAQFRVDNYHFWRKDRNAHGGGIVMYIRSDLPCDRKQNMECEIIESIAAELVVNENNKLLKFHRTDFDNMAESEEKENAPIRKKGLLWGVSYNNPASWTGWYKPGAYTFLKMKWSEKNEAGIPDEEELNRTLPVHKLDEDGKEKLKNPKDPIQFMWIGHATFLVQFDGLTVLADPVFLKRCSPLQVVGPIRYRPTPCEIEDLPKIDAVVVSHNHYDHLEHDAVEKLNRRFKDIKWYVPEGTGSWFQGYHCQNVKEMTWWKEDVVNIGEKKVTFCCVPAQHWSQRTATDAMQSLWCGWVIKNCKHTFYYSGDTGYCPVFKTIGDKYGPIDLSAIPIGCYAPRYFMKPQHINPDEAVLVHKEVRSKCSIAIHWGTFDGLGSHEPYLQPKEFLDKAVKEANLDNMEFFTVEHGKITKIPIESNGDTTKDGEDKVGAKM